MLMAKNIKSYIFKYESAYYFGISLFTEIFPKTARNHDLETSLDVEYIYSMYSVIIIYPIITSLV